MAKFLNKKEQVYDFKLTSYGNYLLSINKFNPIFYAFFDNNIIYDMQYANTGVSGLSGEKEAQNEISYRIKEETPYLESLVLYENVENNVRTIGENYYEVNRTAVQEKPAYDAFKFYNAIGDAYLDGNPEFAPAWKIISLGNDITSSAPADEYSQTIIPQIDMVCTYSKRVVPWPDPNEAETIDKVVQISDQFIDGSQIELIARDPLIYADEINTMLLTENFEVEVFEVVYDSVLTYASASLRLLSNPTADTDYIKISDSANIIQFDFVSSSPTNNQVEVGSTSLDSLINLINAINDSTLNISVSTFSITDYPNLALLNNYGGTRSNDRSKGGLASIETNSPSIIDITGLFDGGTNLKKSLKRKLFVKDEPQIVDGLMIAGRPLDITAPEVTTGSVEYYFNFLVDREIDTETACKAAVEFNKDSYYIDLDFDCSVYDEDPRKTYYDIYGRVTEPEECLD